MISTPRLDFSQAARVELSRSGSRSTTSLVSRLTSTVPYRWPLRHAQSSTPRTRGACLTCRSARTIRSIVSALTRILSRSMGQAPASPPKASPTERWMSRRRTVRRAWRPARFSVRSAKIRCMHLRLIHRSRRTWTQSMTGRPCQGRSATCRWYLLCNRDDTRRRLGQRGADDRDRQWSTMRAASRMTFSTVSWRGMSGRIHLATVRQASSMEPLRINQIHGSFPKLHRNCWRNHLCG